MKMYPHPAGGDRPSSFSWDRPQTSIHRPQGEFACANRPQRGGNVVDVPTSGASVTYQGSATCRCVTPCEDLIGHFVLAAVSRRPPATLPKTQAASARSATRLLFMCADVRG